MDVEIKRDGYKYSLHFEHGENIGGLKKEEYTRRDTGTRIHWKPDIEVFTDIDVSAEYFLDIMKRQAIVNAGVEFIFRNQNGRSFDTTVFNYVNGIEDHVREIVGEDGLSTVQYFETERKVRDRADKPEYKCRICAAMAFSNKIAQTEYYHNSSWLEYGGAPEKAVKNAFVYMIDSYLKKIQGGVRHTGKMPRFGGETVEIPDLEEETPDFAEGTGTVDEIRITVDPEAAEEELRSALKRAVAREDYEQAARIRDLLKERKGEDPHAQLV